MTTLNPKFSSRDELGSFSERAYFTIRDRILKGELALGAPISRRKLALELGMSLIPVTEALQRLESEGLVESWPRSGTRVCSPTAEDIRERVEVREALETQAARLFAEKATFSQRVELLRMAEHMDALYNRCASGDNDPEYLFAVQSFHFQLHLKIAEYTGCRALQQAIEKNHTLVFNWLFDVAAGRPARPPRFHRELIETISKGDAEEADRAMRQHIRHGLNSVVSALDPDG